MTQAEFIAYAQTLESVTDVNIWYTDTAPYIIQGITIPTIDSNGQNILAFLDQIQQITVPISIGGTATNLTLDIIAREVYTTLNGNFYFYTITPYIATSITQGIFTGINANISFTPAINSNIFYSSPYNTTYGLVEKARISTNIMLSDRYKVGTPELPGYTGPININELLAGSASKASVQDSLYSDTGWSNGRYDGTEQIYTGTNVSPAVNGKLFRAAEFPISASTSQINYQISSSIVLYVDYFYTGIGDVPEFSSPRIQNILISGSTYTGDSTVIQVKGIGGNDPLQYLPAIGSTIGINGTSDESIGSIFEVMYVTSVSLFSTTPYKVYRIKVIRRYDGTPQPAIDTQIVPEDGDYLYEIKPTQIYQLQRNKLIGVNKSLLLVEETGKILTLNEYGYVISNT